MAINEELSGFLKEGLERGLPREQLERDPPRDGVARPIRCGGALRSLRRRHLSDPCSAPEAVPVRPRGLRVPRSVQHPVRERLQPGQPLCSSSSTGRSRTPPLDPTMALARSREAMRWSISMSSIVAFPVFVFVSWTNDRAVPARS